MLNSIHSFGLWWLVVRFALPRLGSHTFIMALMFMWRMILKTKAHNETDERCKMTTNQCEKRNAMRARRSQNKSYWLLLQCVVFLQMSFKNHIVCFGLRRMMFAHKLLCMFTLILGELFYSLSLFLCLWLCMIFGFVSLFLSSIFLFFSIFSSLSYNSFCVPIYLIRLTVCELSAGIFSEAHTVKFNAALSRHMPLASVSIVCYV